MHSDTSPDFDGSASDAARRSGMAIVVTAAIVLAGACLLNCPGRFSELHEKDTSLLRPIVSALGLFGEYGTQRGVEVRNLVFYAGAAGLSIIAGLSLALGSVRSRYSIDDLLDGRSRAASPVFWWLILLVVSALSSIFSHAPAFCQGQMIVRLLLFSWWWPIATILSPRQTRALAVAFVTALTATAALGLAYHFLRVWPHQPGARLQYPLGNELWMAACLLPGVFVTGGLALSRIRNHSSPDTNRPAKPAKKALGTIALVACLILLVIVLALTRSRSAAVGLATGIGACIIIALPAKRRIPAFLVMCVVAIAATLYVQQLRVDGSTAGRAHSIRARLDYEWPYALRLFMSKPIAGNGDGAYALLAGQLGRDDQLDDPGVMRFDESSWPAHAHNEFLELLADLGIVGTLAFLIALGIPLYRAARYFDNRRDQTGNSAQRWFVVGLAGALVAMIAEACGTPAIREPGANVIFITVWACLWAAVRRQDRVNNSPDKDDKPVALGTVRLFGIAVCISAIVLGYRGAEDWWAARARFDAQQSLEADDPESAVIAADFAATHALDPFQRAQAMTLSVWARSLLFDRIIASQDQPPTNADMDISHAAVSILNSLDRIAPRFLKSSRLRADLALNRARAYARRGDLRSEAECKQNFIAALEQSRADEPFSIDRVEALWIIRSATTEDRLHWLRSLLRGGEVEPAFHRMLREAMAAPDFEARLAGLLAIAQEDAEAPPSKWKDKLSPESFRIAAMVAAVNDDFPRAMELNALATELYKAGLPRLFAGLGASIHDAVRFRLIRDPLADVDKNLADLYSAFEAAYGPIELGALIPDPVLAQTRAVILLAANKESDARSQLEYVRQPNSPPIDLQLSDYYLQLAAMTASSDSPNPDRQAQFASRAEELDPASPRPQALMAEQAFSRNDEAAAVSAIRRLVELQSGRPELGRFFQSLRERYPDSAIWQRIAAEFPQIVPAAPSSQPAE